MKTKGLNPFYEYGRRRIITLYVQNLDAPEKKDDYMMCISMMMMQYIIKNCWGIRALYPEEPLCELSSLVFSLLLCASDGLRLLTPVCGYSGESPVVSYHCAIFGICILV